MKTESFRVRKLWAALAAAALVGAMLQGCAGLVRVLPTPETRLAQRAAGEIGATRGLCVVLGDPSCRIALALARETELLVYVQLPETKDVERARRTVDAAGLYGTRIYIEKGPVSRLHLGDNLADGLVAVGDAAGMPEEEALRVLHPQGKAFLGEKELVKPFPDGLDDWSHPYHGPDNNPLSRDQAARAPYLTQFLADPRYAPLPQAAVASAGRVFKVFGHIAFKEREEPWLDTLAAFNGYNGALLWRRPIPPALMVHRSTLIATPTTVYFGDDTSCKVIEAATGKLLDEIAPPEEAADGTFWKWMALEDGALYALIGEQEERDPVITARRTGHGWPWDPLSPGFNQPEHTWGFGQTLLAIDPATKRILWRHREAEPIDSRALCMSSGRIYAFRFGAYLTCLDAKTGQEVWRKTKGNAPKLFAALGPYLNRQDYRTNWRTTAYLKSSDKALYFAGPPIGKLLAVSAKDGKILWQHPYGNAQLVLCDEGLYAVSGQSDREPTRRFDPLSGKILEEIPLGRRACTRPTGSTDAIFFRGGEGTTRIDRASNRPRMISPMRPQCHDGVTIANGLLYWWPSVCDCNLSLFGITCLGPAGDFDFDQPAVESERLEESAGQAKEAASFPLSPADWPAFRANNTGTAVTRAAIPGEVRVAWNFTPPAAFTPTAPTAAGGLVFVGGSDGIVRALSARTGKVQWKAYTGGAVRYPPAIWEGRAFVGSGDGWVYCFEAKTGRLLWRFRAAPVERRIPVYGGLQSTWPAASGVLVSDGVAYVAAGMVNYDGTHVYALDAATGRIKWQNNVSGDLDPETGSGVSVQGHVLLVDGKLCLAGGNAVSPALYDAADGRCLNNPKAPRNAANSRMLVANAPSGSELYEIGGEVRVSGRPFYGHPRYPLYLPGLASKILLATTGGRAVAWVNNARLVCFDGAEPNLAEKLRAAWGKPRLGVGSIWEKQCKDSMAVAVGPNAVVAAGPGEVAAYDLGDGWQLWSKPLPAPPVPWGLAVDRDGRVVVALEGGKAVCFRPR